MPENTADVVAPTGSDFTIRISSGTINSATLETDQSSTPLTVTQNGKAVDVKNTPSGDSFVSMAMIWKPGDTDAIVSVTPPAKAAVPPPVIDLGDNPGSVTIFGKD
jgi:hypothetical protein